MGRLTVTSMYMGATCHLSKQSTSPLPCPPTTERAFLWVPISTQILRIPNIRQLTFLEITAPVSFYKESQCNEELMARIGLSAQAKNTFFR